MKCVKTSLSALCAIIALLFLFLGCEEKSGEQTKPKQEILENLTLSASDATLIINQKPTKEQNNFKNIAPKKENILKNLIVTSDAKIKILVFFTTWCDPCKGILPHLDNLKQQFGEDIAFFGIPVDDFVEEVENLKSSIQVFKEENATPFPIITDENRTKLFRALGGIEGVPLIALYGADGEYLIHYLGAIPEEMIEFDLARNLAKIKAR